MGPLHGITARPLTIVVTWNSLSMGQAATGSRNPSAWSYSTVSFPCSVHHSKLRGCPTSWGRQSRRYQERDGSACKSSSWSHWQHWRWTCNYRRGWPQRLVGPADRECTRQRRPSRHRPIQPMCITWQQNHVHSLVLLTPVCSCFGHPFGVSGDGTGYFF